MPTIEDVQLNKSIMEQINRETNIPVAFIKTAVNLLQEGNTVPFIARYRKEATGSLDEEQLRQIDERWRYIQQLWQRKEDVLSKIEEQGKLTDDLRQNIIKADKLQQVEDFYRPYKQKRRTKAIVAKEKGLDPLAEWLLTFSDGSPEEEAQRYVSEEKEVSSTEEALQGAMDIIAEQVADDPKVRQWVRKTTYRQGQLVCVLNKKKVADNPDLDKNSVFQMYYDYNEAVERIVPHRILAINRGEKEEILKVSLDAPVEQLVRHVDQSWVKKERSPSTPYVREAVADAYKRLVAPAVERDIRRELTEKAEEQAVQIFSKNLRSLLLQPPVRGKRILGLDPAFRTGCKLAAVDETGKLLEVDVIYPTAPHHRVEEAGQTISKILDQYNIQIVAIGNGTASRETEEFMAKLIAQRNDGLAYMIINEAGASVYSASPLAKEEFPALDVSERSAVSIARRLQDPLAELVKIDPKSIGVGQYQHDVSQTFLKDSLSFVVETAVNQVGVDVNTASVSLLQYVSGLNKSVAREIVSRRDEEGSFGARNQLKKVPRLGAKTYEQAIGFLRIFGDKDPFDQTPIHPESYKVAELFIEGLGLHKNDIGTDQMSEALTQADLTHWSEQLSVGIPTLEDIVQSLLKPGRDPRDELQQPKLQKNILQMEDLSEGLQLEGTVRNVVDFGAFVDIGLKNDGLVHISRMKNGFVKHPMDVVSVGDIVTVWVMDIDRERGRVGLSLIPAQ